MLFSELFHPNTWPIDAQPRSTCTPHSLFYNYNTNNNQRESMDVQPIHNPQNDNDEYEDDFDQMVQSLPQKQLETSQVRSQDSPSMLQRVEMKQDQEHSQLIQKQNLAQSKSVTQKESGKKRDLKDAETENKIKETINRLTKNIITSKTEIVNEITTINKYQQQNQKQIKYKQKNGIRYVPYQKISEKSHPLQSMKKRLEQIEKEKILEQMRAKEEEKKRKKQIYFMQKMERMERKHITKDKSRMKEQELEKRIMYQQKFKSRKGISPQHEKIDEGQIKMLEDAFIQRIKDRLNIGQKRNKRDRSEKTVPVRSERRKNVMERQQALKKYNKKINQDNKFKQKILMNLKIKREQEEGNENEQLTKEIKNNRNYYSAPDIKLPQLERRMSKRTTLYEKTISAKKQKQSLALADHPHIQPYSQHSDLFAT